MKNRKKKTFSPFIPERIRPRGETKLTQFGFVLPQFTPHLNSWEKTEAKTSPFFTCYFCGEIFIKGHGETHPKNEFFGFCEICVKNLRKEKEQAEKFY